MRQEVRVSRCGGQPGIVLREGAAARADVALRARVSKHELAPTRRGRKYALATHEMLPRRHDEPGEAAQKLERVKKRCVSPFLRALRSANAMRPSFVRSSCS